MEFDKIISVSGQGSLFTVINTTKFGLVAESLENGKKMPIYAHYNVSKLDDISMYTENGEVPLKEVLLKTFEKQEGKTIDNVNSNEEVKAFFESVLPDYDKEKVYVSDIRKLVKWYNQLVAKNLIDPEAWKKVEEEQEKEKEKDEKKDKEPKKTTEAKTKAKTTTKTKTQTVKNAPAKKVQTVRKSGGS